MSLDSETLKHKSWCQIFTKRAGLLAQYQMLVVVQCQSANITF